MPSFPKFEPAQNNSGVKTHIIPNLYSSFPLPNINQRQDRNETNGSKGAQVTIMSSFSFSSAPPPPRVHVIAASDPSGGAGLEADQRVLACHGVYAMTTTTALTEQDTCGVWGEVVTIDPGFVGRCFRRVWDDIGMGSTEREGEGGYGQDDHGGQAVVKIGRFFFSLSYTIVLFFFLPCMLRGLASLLWCQSCASTVESIMNSYLSILRACLVL